MIDGYFTIHSQVALFIHLKKALY